MSSAGRAVSSNGCVTKPKEHAIGLAGCAVSIRSSSLTGSYVMETAEHREPYESRGSRTVLGAPGGETPPGDSTNEPCQSLRRPGRSTSVSGPDWPGSALPGRANHGHRTSDFAQEGMVSIGAASRICRNPSGQSAGY